MRHETDDADPPDRTSDGGVSGMIDRPFVVRTDREHLAALIAAVRGQVRNGLPRLERSVRALHRGAALEQAAELRRALWMAADEAAFRAGLEREDEPGAEAPPAGTRWAW
ncbi:MAG: hypothetical protein K9G59_06730 [Caulobacter sp.]|nr:hypothetical protein [Caulobacter sp.]